MFLFLMKCPDSHIFIILTIVFFNDAIKNIFLPNYPGEKSWSLTLIKHGWLPFFNLHHGQPPWSTMSISDYGQTLPLTMTDMVPEGHGQQTIYCPSVTMVNRVLLWSNIVFDHGQTRLTMIPFLIENQMINRWIQI